MTPIIEDKKEEEQEAYGIPPYPPVPYPKWMLSTRRSQSLTKNGKE